MDLIGLPTRPGLYRISRQTGLATAFLLIIANSLFAMLTYFELHRANQLLGLTQEIRAALQDVRELVRQTGASDRAYLLTHDGAFLKSYSEADAAIPPLLARLHTLTSGDAGQRDSMNGLAARIGQDRQRLADSIAAAQSLPGHQPTVSDLIASRSQSEILARSVGDDLDSVRHALEKNFNSAEHTTLLALLLVSAATVISIVVLAKMLRRMQGEARARTTQLAGAGAALRDSQQRFRLVFEESPLGIVLVQTGSLRIVQANPVFCAVLGYNVDELTAMSLAEIAHVDDLDPLIDAIDRTTNASQMIETRCVTYSGVITWARLRLTLLSTPDQHEPLLLVLTEDITRETQVAAELRQSQKMEAIGQLTGGIAHDFNNLLGVIIGNTEFLLDVVSGDDDHAGLAREILNSALSGADLTRRLLAFARRQSLQPRRIDLNTYLPNHIAIVRRLLGETIQVTTALAGDLWSTRADPSQVGDALLNLAINPRDAMPHGGTLVIETANAHLAPDQRDAQIAPGDYVVLAVTDTGTGMPPELLERVMEPFFTTKPPGSGSGLGLSMIYGFAKQSSGHLTIESEPGRGTTVRLYLPRALGTVASPADGGPDASLPAGNEAILLVDDNAEMRNVARRHLASLGYKVSEAASGPAALALLQNNDSFDLLFTDVVMPDGMTGYQLAAVAQQLRPELRVLFTTGYARSMPGSDPVAVHPGAMLRKPYRKQELATKVRAVLEA